MKYKKLTDEQILISLDRLTRFKSTKAKYLRVFGDILISCLIEPKLKKTDIENADFRELSKIVSEIFNSSVKSTVPDLKINEYIKQYENSVFINNNETQNLLDNTIDYKAALKYINDSQKVNLKWLKCVVNQSYTQDFNEMYKLREKEALKYPLEKIILVEGITEEILLPAFSKLLGKDFYQKGIQIIAAGGKNQVVKLFYELSDEVKLPIFVLLDKDAEENISQIRPKLRTKDKIHLVSCGEFEDLLPHKLIIKTINSHFINFLNISEGDLCGDSGMAKILSELFRTKGLHEFKKADFAKLVRENITDKNDISEEIETIIDEIFI